MTINRDHWLLKYAHLFTPDTLSWRRDISLCVLFWRSVLTTLLLGFGLFVVGVVLTATVLHPIRAVATIGIIVGTVWILTSISGWLTRRRQAREWVPNRPPNLFVLTLKSIKSKFCPIFELD